MNETKLTNYLIISAHCLKNVNGRGMLKYFMDEVRCLKPLVTVPFDDHNPMFRYHDTIRTTRNLTGRMILNVLRKPYNMFRSVQSDEVFFAVHEDGILYCHHDKASHDWVIKDWDDVMDDQDFVDPDLTAKQAEKIESKMMDFYNEYIENPRMLHSLEKEYLTLLYC